jgi:hypothetical protein
MLASHYVLDFLHSKFIVDPAIGFDAKGFSYARNAMHVN